MKKYTKENFCNSIFEVTKGLFSGRESENIKEKFFYGIQTFILSRLEIFTEKAKFFFIEEDYTETEWKDMISLHYVHTSYNLKNDVIRIHFFDKNELSSDHYLGFITLRSINEIRSMLSFIYPNFRMINCTENSYIMGYEKFVHINSTELILYTYPCLVQDGIVASCIHVNILMMSHYLHNIHNLKTIRLREMEKDYTYRRAKQYPTRGLIYTQVLEIFANNRIPINNFMLLEDSESKLAIFEKYINVYIESRIPVMLGIQEHVIHIIGHELVNNKYKYIVYDDSGVFLKSEYDSNSFIRAVDWDDIKDKLRIQDFIVAPEYEKIFMSWESFLRLFMNHVLEQNTERANGRDKTELSDIRLLSIINQKNNTEYNELTREVLMKHMRMLFVDNVEFKKFLSLNIFSLGIDEDSDKKYQDEFEKILALRKPHYYWYCELPVGDYYMCFIADPTFSQYTVSDIFINESPLFIEKQLSLLDCKDSLKG